MKPEKSWKVIDLIPNWSLKHSKERVTTCSSYKSVLFIMFLNMRGPISCSNLMDFLPETFMSLLISENNSWTSPYI